MCTVATREKCEKQREEFFSLEEDVFFSDLPDELGKKEIPFDRVTDTEFQYHEYFKECVDSAKKLCSVSLDLNKTLKFGAMAVQDYFYYLRDGSTEPNFSENRKYFLLDDDDLTAISAVLKDTQIKNLDLESNKFSINGLLALSSALKESNIEVLNLSANYVYNNRINMLADALPFTNVTSLQLGLFDVDFSCWTHLFDTLAGTKITALNFDSSSLKDKGIKYLSTKLDNSKIKILKLANNSMSDDSLKSLADVLENTAMTELNIAGNKFGCTGAKYLAGKLSKSVLQYLDIGDNLIESEGCSAIGNVIHLTQIISLNLEKNSIDSSGITSLAENLKKSNVKNLNLMGNNLGINGAQILANGLKDSKLECLHVDSNQLTNVGMGIILDALQFTKMTDFILDCASNEMRKEYMKLLTNAFKFLKLETLNLILPKDEDIVRLFFNELQTLIESDTNNELLFIKNKMNFSLDLDFGIFTDGVKHILDVTKHFHMKRLCLNELNLNVDLGVQIPSIVEILIDMSHPISNITTLILNDNILGDIGAGILAENFKYLKLTRLEVHNTYIKNDGVIAIAKELKNSKIRYLNLANNLFDSVAASYLTNVVKNHPVRIRLNYLIHNGFSAEDQLVIKNNNLMFLRAQLLVKSISEDSPVKYDKGLIEHLKAYEIFKSVDLLWESQSGYPMYGYHPIDSEIKSKVTMNFLKIIGVVNSDEIISNLLPPEIIILICSYLKINDVKFN